MTEAKIKTEQIVTPVTYEPISKAVWNARGGLVCKVDEHDANFDTDESIGREQWDELCDEVGFHIANALNRQSELEKRVVHLETVLTATKPLIDAEPQIDDLLNRSGKLLSEVKIKKLEAEAHESAIRTAAAVFFHIASNLAFDFHNRCDVPFDEMCDKNEAFGAYLREMLIQHTGIDMADFRGNPLSAEIVEEIDDDAN